MRYTTLHKVLHGSALLVTVGLTSQTLVAVQSANATAAQTHPAAASMMSDAQVEANVLKALAGAPQLADQNIATTTVYGVVTLSGVVKDEATRSLVETLASRAEGVKKVVGEMTLASDAATIDNSTDQTQHTSAIPPYASGTSIPGPDTAQNTAHSQAPVSRQAPDPRQAPDSSTSEGPYSGNTGRRSRPSQTAQSSAPYGAQQAGLSVVVPSGSMVRIRINEGLDSKRAQPGSTFDGVVLNDVVADGSVAIPRGATIQGSVVDAKPSGALNGRAELVLQLNQVTLGGRVFPVVSDQWSSVGPDKTGQTVGNAVGLGALGAIIGAVAGGGPGAAIGAGVGGVAGVGTSAASGGGQALIPTEAILTFHFTQPASLVTVSQAEMDRLGYGVPVGSQPRLARRPPPSYYGYYGPGYYPRPYPAYYPYPY